MSPLGSIARNVRRQLRASRIGRAVLVLCVLGWGLWPLTSSALQGDDIPNSMRSAVLKITGQSKWESISSGVAQWLRNEGRFFPVSAIENVYLFSAIHSVALYKFVQWLTLIFLILIVGWFVGAIANSKAAWIVVGAGALAALQTRNWYDPTFGFGLLLQSVAIKVFLSAILFRYSLVKQNQLWRALSLLLWIAALLQYEVVITLLPIFLLVGMMTTSRRWYQVIWATTPHITSASVYFLVSQVMRQGKHVTPAYTTNSDLGVVLPTYARQLSSSIPFSAQIWKISPRSLIESMSVISLFIFTGLVIIGVIAVQDELSERSISRKTILGLFLIGLNLVLGPGLPTSLSLRWQDEVSWGLGYLPVFIQYVGFSIILASLVLWLASSRRGSSTHRRLLAIVLAICALSATANRRLMLDNVLAQQPSRESRALYETAVRVGLFADVPAGSIVQSPLSDPNSWVNSYFTIWLGGPSDVVFVRTKEERQTYCQANDCAQREAFRLDQITLQDGNEALLLRSFKSLEGREDSYGAIDPSLHFRVAQSSGSPPPCDSGRPLTKGPSVSIYACDEDPIWADGPDLME